LRAVVTLDPALATDRVAGLSIAEHLESALTKAGFRVVGAAEAEGERVLRVNGPWIGVSPETWARLHDPEQAVLSPAGEPIAATFADSPERYLGWRLQGPEALDPGTPRGRAALALILGQRLVAQWQDAGVTVVDPARVITDVTVRVDPGATLWPDVVLRGSTSIAAGAEIRPGCWVEDSEIGAHVLIKPHCVLEGARVGPQCQVGPMAHLRPGAVLVADNKVGNYVEVKAAVLHRGAKASHLTYLGDAEIGEDANIGAGTITCNYDGHRKHKTRIGARAFIGSNTALVAPIQVGEGAIVGAGSTLTRDVPADALAVVRGEERMLPGKGKALNDRNARLAAAEKAKRS
jgi:bifunctional UDP-N-acetylglucosamine pyrophosphorylase/glucosamine-1-phosphate N-acetyltransferase